MMDWNEPDRCYPEPGKLVLVRLEDSTYRIATYSCRFELWVDANTQKPLLPQDENVEHWAYIYEPGWSAPAQ